MYQGYNRVSPGMYRGPDGRVVKGSSIQPNVGNGMTYAGGSPNFNEAAPGYGQGAGMPPKVGGGMMYAGGSPNFNESAPYGQSMGAAMGTAMPPRTGGGYSYPTPPPTGGGLQLGGQSQGFYSGAPKTGGGLQYGAPTPVQRFNPQMAPGLKAKIDQQKPNKLALALGGM